MANHLSQVVSLQFVRPRDAGWLDAFNRLPVERQDVQFRPEYAAICGMYFHKGSDVACALYEKAGAVVLYPFVRRSLDFMLGDIGLKTGLNDIRGLYGPGGITVSNDDPLLLSEFHSAFGAWCRDNKIICGFDVFHPVIDNSRWAAPSAKILDLGGFVVADLSAPIQEIEKNFKHSVRKNIKKAERAAVDVFSEDGLSHLNDFIAVYNATMDRNEARAFYYLEPAFYKSFVEKLGGHFRFFYARLNGKIVSTELVLIQGQYAHSYLGGTLGDALDACPNHILKREIIRTLKSLGCRYYLLGGGTTPFDGIWNYKKGFAEEGSRPSKAGGVIYDEALYNSLKEKIQGSGKPFPMNRFQFYDRS